jgi:hypothetical protein
MAKDKGKDNEEGIMWNIAYLLENRRFMTFGVISCAASSEHHAPCVNGGGIYLVLCKLWLFILTKTCLVNPFLFLQQSNWSRRTVDSSRGKYQNPSGSKRPGKKTLAGFMFT